MSRKQMLYTTMWLLASYEGDHCECFSVLEFLFWHHISLSELELARQLIWNEDFYIFYSLFCFSQRDICTLSRSTMG